MDFQISTLLLNDLISLEKMKLQDVKADMVYGVIIDPTTRQIERPGMRLTLVYQQTNKIIKEEKCQKKLMKV